MFLCCLPPCICGIPMGGIGMGIGGGIIIGGGTGRPCCIDGGGKPPIGGPNIFGGIWGGGPGNASCDGGRPPFF